MEYVDSLQPQRRVLSILLTVLPLASGSSIKFIHLLQRDAYEDVVGAAQVIRESDLDWTTVRLPMLSNKRSLLTTRARQFASGI
jgi:hypothetical protein